LKKSRQICPALLKNDLTNFKRLKVFWNISISNFVDFAVNNFVEGEADVVDFEKIINDFALLRNKWLGIIKALDIKQWQVSNIVKLRTAGLEDATL